MVGQLAQQHKSTNNTTQDIYTTTYKIYPGFTADSQLLSEIVAQNFYLKVFKYICKNDKMISTNTMHFHKQDRHFSGHSLFSTQYISQFNSHVQTEWSIDNIKWAIRWLGVRERHMAASLSNGLNVGP